MILHSNVIYGYKILAFLLALFGFDKAINPALDMRNNLKEQEQKSKDLPFDDKIEYQTNNDSKDGMVMGMGLSSLSCRCMAGD